MGETETREAGCICIEAHPCSADRAALWELVPSCPVHGTVEALTRLLALLLRARDREGALREAVERLADDADVDASFHGEVQRVKSALLDLAGQCDAGGAKMKADAYREAWGLLCQDVFAASVAPLAARPVLSREVLRERLDGHRYAISLGTLASLCSCGWPETRRGIESDLQSAHLDHLADVLHPQDGGQ